MRTIIVLMTVKMFTIALYPPVPAHAIAYPSIVTEIRDGNCFITTTLIDGRRTTTGPHAPSTCEQQTRTSQAALLVIVSGTLIYWLVKKKKKRKVWRSGFMGFVADAVDPDKQSGYYLDLDKTVNQRQPMIYWKYKF